MKKHNNWLMADPKKLATSFVTSTAAPVSFLGRHSHALGEYFEKEKFVRMKVKSVRLFNFRGYKDETSIDINDLNVFVGKNDIGKSTILEALEIFFNDNKGIIKIDKDDINKKNLDDGNTTIEISVTFEDLPTELTIDSTNPTSFSDEYLLKQDGTLEIIKKFPNAGKEKVFIKAFHPTNPKCKDLLSKKITDLKKILKNEDIECDDKTKSATIRQSIWQHYSDDLQLTEVEIDISKIDAKNSWDQIKKYLPLYFLFQSDRKNSDGDNEVQDPMKLAVKEILNDIELKEALDKVAQVVEEKLDSVASNTLEKLNEMNPDIAESLKPIIPSPDSLKWNDVFKNVTISSDDDIPINKRGSGVKRLVLLNFFRAEAERRKVEKNVPDIIYAIEEPETSQHPNHQRKLIEAFIELSNSNNTQVILTTHSPAIVKLLEFNHIKLVKNSPEKQIINVERGNLPYPSLNEVNFLAFGESNDEYHNELYGFIESEQLLSEFKNGKTTITYNREFRNGDIKQEQKVLSEYIRHQIHHPENTKNPRFSNTQLQQSIGEMRSFISSRSS